MQRASQAPQITASPDTRTAERTKLALALFAVYVIWGSTYLGLRFALESFPPFLLGGIRYSLAGLLAYGLARRSGLPHPTARNWRASFVTGFLLFALGNGLVGVAEHWIDSGVASVVVATAPLWAVLFATMFGERPSGRELVGLVAGLCGVLLLQRGDALGGSAIGITAIVIAPMAWSLGAVLGRRLSLPDGAMASATQMIAGGSWMLLIGLVRGERFGVLTVRASIAFVYLVVFGSFVAFSAFQYLLRNARPALANSGAFVNPIVALALGALLANEPLTIHHAFACALTAVAVFAVLRKA